MKRVIAELSDASYAKLLVRKARDGFSDKTFSDWLTDMVRVETVDPVLSEQIKRGTRGNLPMWMRSFALNLPMIRCGRCIRDLAEPEPLRPPDHRAVIIGAGPSVYRRKHLELLAHSDFEGKIIASDRILIPALKAGLVPDYVVSVDGSPLVKPFYEDPLVEQHAPDMALILCSQIDHGVAELVHFQDWPVYWFQPGLDNIDAEVSVTKALMLMTCSPTNPDGLVSLDCLGNTGATCVLPNTGILCNPREKAILDIKVGDLVATHNNAFKKVSRKYIRNFKGLIYRIKPTGGLPFYLTGEHPLLVLRWRQERFRKMVGESQRKGQKTNPEGLMKKFARMTFSSDDFDWITPPELVRGDYLVYPINRDIQDLDSLLLPKRYDQNKENRQRVIRMRAETGWGRKRISGALGLPLGTVGKWIYSPPKGLKDGALPLPETVAVDENLMRLIGYYLAEGSSTEGTIKFAFNISETPYMDEVFRLMEELFGIKGKRDDRGGLAQLIFHNASLGDFFKQFGESATTKYVPRWVMTLPPEKQVALVEGLLRGDGHYDDGCWGFSSASRELSLGLRDILLRMNIMGTLWLEKREGISLVVGRLCKIHDRYRLQINGVQSENEFSKRLGIRPKRLTWYGMNDKYVVVPIRKIDIEQYEGEVQNLEVEDDQSYCVPSSLATLHNCWVFSWSILKRSDIALVGMDLGYPGDMPLPETPYYERSVEALGPIVAQTKYERVYHPFFKTESWIDPAFKGYRENLYEALLRKPPWQRTVNCTEGGTIIHPNIDYMMFKDWLEEGREN